MLEKDPSACKDDLIGLSQKRALLQISTKIFNISPATKSD
jgi:hypothetical protein